MKYQSRTAVSQPCRGHPHVDAADNDDRRPLSTEFELFGPYQQFSDTQLEFVEGLGERRELLYGVVFPRCTAAQSSTGRATTGSGTTAAQPAAAEVTTSSTSSTLWCAKPVSARGASCEIVMRAHRLEREQHLSHWFIGANSTAGVSAPRCETSSEGQRGLLRWMPDHQGDGMPTPSCRFRRVVGLRWAVLCTAAVILIGCGSTAGGTSSTATFGVPAPASTAHSSRVASMTEVAKVTAAGTALTSGSTPVSATTASPPDSDRTVHALAAAGVVVTGPDLQPTAGAFSISPWQATIWAGQVTVGGGISGAALRERFPVPAGQVPVDALVATWLTRSITAAAAAARTLVPMSTLTDPDTFLYPWAVLAAFSNDIIGGGLRTGSIAQQPLGLHLPGRALAGDLCSSAQELFDSTLTMIGSWFTVSPDDGMIVALAKEAVSAFGNVIKKIVGTVLAPVLAPLKAAVGAVAVATAVAGAVVPWTATIVAEPDSTAFGIAPAPGDVGAFMLRVSTPLPQWPEAVLSCATLLGVDLPDPSPAGEKITWDFHGNGMATEQSHDDTLAKTGANATGRFKYLTGVETAQQATGPLRLDSITANASVGRSNQQLAAVLTVLVDKALSALPGPIAALLGGTAAQKIAGLLFVSGPTATGPPVQIAHHDAPPHPTIAATTPTTPIAQGCLDRVLTATDDVSLSTMTLHPTKVTLLARSDHTALFKVAADATDTDATATVAGSFTFKWNGKPVAMTTYDYHGSITITVSTQGISQTVDVNPQDFVGASAVMTCHTDGSITIAGPKSAWTFH